MSEEREVTPIQKKVLFCLLEGKTYREIQKKMGWSNVSTVAFHVGALRKKGFSV